MKKFLTWILLLAIFINPLYIYAEEGGPEEPETIVGVRTEEDPLGLVAEAAVLIDANTLDLLYEKNPHKKLYPASTTKIMTGILAIELGNLSDKVIIDKEVSDSAEGSHIALEPGEELSLRELLYALLIQSANDSAVAVAKHISGTTEAFIDLMNSKAKELGAENTHFVNPHGLHDEDHYTTAYDLSLIAKYAMENDIFRSYVKEYLYTISPTNKKTEPRYLKSNNRMVYSTIKIDVNGETRPTKYEGANGVKTGYTNAAQNCLVTSVEKNNMHLISVVLKSHNSQVFVDSHKLLDHGFNNYRSLVLGRERQFIDNFKIKNGKLPLVPGILSEDINISLSMDSQEEIEERVTVNKDLKAPLKKGEPIGKIQYIYKDKVLKETDIISTIEVDFDKSSTFLGRLIGKWYLLVFLLLILFRIYVVKKKQKMRQIRRLNRQQKNRT